MKDTLRMCVVCKKMLPKSELTRLVKSKDGQILIDVTKKLDGRGAYICRSEDCLLKLKKQRSFNRAFKQQLDEKIYDNILDLKEN